MTIENYVIIFRNSRATVGKASDDVNSVCGSVRTIEEIALELANCGPTDYTRYRGALPVSRSNRLPEQSRVGDRRRNKSASRDRKMSFVEKDGRPAKDEEREQKIAQ
ncbi:hypothetical protein Trydic_g2306 [Trypoxylus dichotomus]